MSEIKNWSDAAKITDKLRTRPRYSRDLDRKIELGVEDKNQGYEQRPREEHRCHYTDSDCGLAPLRAKKGQNFRNRSMNKKS